MCGEEAVPPATRPADSGTIKGRQSLGLYEDEKLSSRSKVSVAHNRILEDKTMPTNSLWERIELIPCSKIFKTSGSGPGVVSFADSRKFSGLCWLCSLHKTAY